MHFWANWIKFLHSTNRSCKWISWDKMHHQIE